MKVVRDADPWEDKAAPTGVFAHSNRGLTHLSYQEGVTPMLRNTTAPGRPDDRAKLAPGCGCSPTVCCDEHRDDERMQSWRSNRCLACGDDPCMSGCAHPGAPFIPVTIDARPGGDA